MMHIAHAVTCGRYLPAFPVACWHLYLHPGVIQVELWIPAAQYAPMFLAGIKVAVSSLYVVLTLLVDPREPCVL